VSLAGAGVFVLYLTFELLAMVLQVGIAALVVVTVSLLGMAGWMQRRRVRSVRRRATRAAVSRVTGRHPGRRSRSPAMYEARARAKVARRQARWQRRDELWTRRKATAVRVAGRIRQGWSQ
jgi:hypothetical protein